MKEDKNKNKLQTIMQKQKNEIEYITLSNSKDYFQTSDLGLATALCCRGYNLITLDKENSNKVSFIFKREIDIEQETNDYWADRLEIKARMYFDNLRTLKNRIYSK